MALLNMPVSKITYSDLDSFFNTDPPQTEGIHLEFKSREIVNDKLSEAISAFANTRGGWIFVGIEEIGEKSGKASWPPKGIDYDPNYGDRIDHIVQDRIFPYLSLDVNPVRLPDDPTKMVAVIRIPESELAPHYTHDENGGAKVYVRREAGKDKKPWDNLIAMENELERLMNRRTNIHKMREDFIARSIRRIESTGMKQPGSPLLIISIIPIFPVTPIFEHEILRAVVENNLPKFTNTDDLPAPPNTVGNTRITQKDSHLWLSDSPLRFLLEITKFGQITLSCHPLRKNTDRSAFITLQYVIFPIIWMIYLSSKISTPTITHIFRIRMEEFRKWGFDYNLDTISWFGAGDSTKKLDRIDECIEFDVEYKPNPDPYEINRLAMQVVPYLAWVLDLDYYTENFEKVAKGYIEAGNQAGKDKLK